MTQDNTNQQIQIAPEHMSQLVRLLKDIAPIYQRGSCYVTRAKLKTYESEVDVYTPAATLSDDQKRLDQLRNAFKALDNLRSEHVQSWVSLPAKLKIDGRKFFVLMRTTCPTEVFTPTFDQSSTEDRINLFRRLSYGVRDLHQLGLVHGNLHAGAVRMEEPGGLPRLCDFAFPMGHNISIEEQPLAYQAPSLLRDAAPSAQTDLHALGMIGYRIFLGSDGPSRVISGGESAGHENLERSRIQAGQFAPATGDELFPEGHAARDQIADILARLIETEGQKFTDGVDFSAALDAALSVDGGPVGIEPLAQGGGAKPAPTGESSPWRVIGLLGAIALVGGGGYFAYQYRETTQTLDRLAETCAVSEVPAAAPDQLKDIIADFDRSIQDARLKRDVRSLAENCQARDRFAVFASSLADTNLTRPLLQSWVDLTAQENLGTDSAPYANAQQALATFDELLSGIELDDTARLQEANGDAQQAADDLAAHAQSAVQAKLARLRDEADILSSSDASILRDLPVDPLDDAQPDALAAILAKARDATTALHAEAQAGFVQQVADQEAALTAQLAQAALSEPYHDQIEQQTSALLETARTWSTNPIGSGASDWVAGTESVLGDLKNIGPEIDDLEAADAQAVADALLEDATFAVRDQGVLLGAGRAIAEATGLREQGQSKEATEAFRKTGESLRTMIDTARTETAEAVQSTQDALAQAAQDNVASASSQASSLIDEATEALASAEAAYETAQYVAAFDAAETGVARISDARTVQQESTDQAQARRLEAEDARAAFATAELPDSDVSRNADTQWTSAEGALAEKAYELAGQHYVEAAATYTLAVDAAITEVEALRTLVEAERQALLGLDAEQLDASDEVLARAEADYQDGRYGPARTAYAQLLESYAALRLAAESKDNEPRRATLGSSPEALRAAIELCLAHSPVKTNCPTSRPAAEAAREVTLEPFVLDTHEVTVGAFRAFVEATDHETDAESSGISVGIFSDNNRSDFVNYTWTQPAGPGSSSPDTMPVVNISYRDASAYCAWAEKRLPTANEWEYVARNAGQSRFPWGDSWDSGAAVWRGSTASRVDGVRSVASASGATPSGHLGLSGNVREWVTIDGGSALKGGSWMSVNPADLRAAAVLPMDANTAGIDFGFRCATSTEEWP